MAVGEAVEVNSSCKHCTLGTFCRSADPDSPLVTGHQVLKRRESLYSYRDSFSSIYAIASGAIKTFQIDVEGKERIHQFYLPGEILGFEAIHPNYFPLSAMAITNTKVCRISYERLIDFVTIHPHLFRRLMESVSQRFNFGVYVTAATAEQRMASFLLELCGRIPNNLSTQDVDLCMSRQDIGNYLGLAAETISRVLSRFKNRKLIVITNKKINVLDSVKLQWIAQDGLADPDSFS